MKPPSAKNGSVIAGISQSQSIPVWSAQSSITVNTAAYMERSGPRARAAVRTSTATITPTSNRKPIDAPLVEHLDVQRVPIPLCVDRRRIPELASEVAQPIRRIQTLVQIIFDRASRLLGCGARDAAAVRASAAGSGRRGGPVVRTWTPR